jgi:transcription elongation factor Elf1
MTSPRDDEDRPVLWEPSPCHCPKCNGHSIVRSTVNSEETGQAIMRWHLCKECGHSFKSNPPPPKL